MNSTRGFRDFEFFLGQLQSLRFQKVLLDIELFDLDIGIPTLLAGSINLSAIIIYSGRGRYIRVFHRGWR